MIGASAFLFSLASARVRRPRRAGESAVSSSAASALAWILSAAAASIDLELMKAKVDHSDQREDYQQKQTHDSKHPPGERGTTGGAGLSCSALQARVLACVTPGLLLLSLFNTADPRGVEGLHEVQEATEATDIRRCCLRALILCV